MKTVPFLCPANNHWRETSNAIRDVLKTRWWGQSKKCDEFEKEFGKKFGFKYVLALNSGSSALELAYHLIGVSKGDEVIVPVLTCTATNIPLLRLGAKIVFADIDNNLTISFEDIERKISKKTKAIVVVNLGGLMVDPGIFKLAKRYNIPVVVDAAQSLGIPEPNGDYVCYSLQAVKHFSTGDGGVLICRNEKDYIRAKKLRWFGIDREKKIKADWQPYQKRHMTMDIEEAGYKMHMNDIAATMGLVGLKYSDDYLKHRIKIATIYNNIKYPKIVGGSFWLYGLLVEKRDELAEELLNAGIGTNMAHLRNDIFKVFGGKRLNLPNMNKLESMYLYIPIHTRMSIDDALKAVKIINQ